MAKKKTDIEIMEDKDIMRAAMVSREIKQAELADMLGMKQPSLSGNMNRSRIGLDTVGKILKALDYDVVIADHKTGEVVWQVKI